MMITKHKIIRGTAISAGIAMGKARVVLPGYLDVAEIPISASAVRTELESLDTAVSDTVRGLRKLRDSAGRKMGSAITKVFDAQLLIAEDQDFLKRVREQIMLRRRNAGFVYNALVQEAVMPLKRSSDKYMRQMAHEIEAVSNHILSHLSGYSEESSVRFQKDTVLVGRSFTPGEVLGYRNRRATGLLAGGGGANSHTALIARSLMLPMISLGSAWAQIPDGSRLIFDGTEGLAIVNPSDSEWTEYLKKRKGQGPAILRRITKLSEMPPRTADGVTVEIAANLEFPGPVDEILAVQKIPVGLYRTEFLYLNSKGFPDEQTQFDYYSRIADRFIDSCVVMRTFDLGSDKLKTDRSMPDESNPALGWRGIRSMLELPDVFRTQIRALLRASTHKSLKILLPMISDLGELKKARRLISQVMFELRREGVEFDKDIKIGIMVEVPSAALTADQLAQNADFVSIGTNDLTQYTMSADRNNTRVAGLYNPFHPSVLSLIKMTVDACRKHKIQISVCGETAGDSLAIPLFIGMGISHLSMNPTRIVDASRLIKKIDSKLVQHLVGPVMASTTIASVTRKLQNYRNALEKI